MKHVLFVVVSLFTAALLSGCATIFKGSTDNVHVAIANCGEPIMCKAHNNQAKKFIRWEKETDSPFLRKKIVSEKIVWDFTAPGTVAFDKSENPLTITCQDGDELLRTQIAPEPGGWLWLNIIAPIPLVGFFVDAGTDAHWQTPDSVTLNRAYCRGKKTGP